MEPSKIHESLLRLLPGPQPLVVRYSATAILVLLSFAIMLGMKDYTGLYGFTLYLPAIVASAIIFDRRSGYFAILLTLACVATYLPWEASALATHVSAIATFIVVATSLVFVGEGLRRALEKAE